MSAFKKGQSWDGPYSKKVPLTRQSESVPLGRNAYKKGQEYSTPLDHEYDGRDRESIRKSNLGDDYQGHGKI